MSKLESRELNRDTKKVGKNILSYLVYICLGTMLGWFIDSLIKDGNSLNVVPFEIRIGMIVLLIIGIIIASKIDL